jgi:membrane protein YdbS with pleckstrin-like domain
MPYLWGLTTVISVLLCWAILMVAGRYGYWKTPLKRWSIAFGLFVIFMVFISPVIVGIGSILITGRTM